METKKYFVIIFLISIFCGCQKDIPSENGGGTNTSNVIGNFNVTVVFRNQTQSTIKWTRPIIPPNTNLKFKIYLSNNLIVQNFLDSNFVITNLLPNQSYQGKVVAYISQIDSSVSNFSLNVFNQTSSDSTFILTGVNNSSGLNLKLTYDEINKRYSSWQEYYNVVNNDSTIIFYGANDKIISVVRKQPSTNSEHRLTPHIFEYTNNLITKIYHKRYIEINQQYQYLSQAYLTTVDFSLVYNDIESYDSLTYYPNNRLKSCNNIKVQQVLSLPTYSLSYNLFSYSSQNDSLLQNIKEYSRLDTTQPFTLTNYDFLNYSNKTNPYYQGFKNLFPLLCSKTNYLTKLPTLPQYYFSYAPINRYFITNPYLCLNYNTINNKIHYQYNSDSLLSRCYWDNDQTEWVTFNYTKYKK